MELSIIDRRKHAVHAMVARIRALLTAHGINRAALAQVEPILIELAIQSDLFPSEDFPITAEYDGVIYRLCEDKEHRYALFASVGRPGKARGIHNHTTWAVIAGVRGDEHNVCYERGAGRDELRPLREITVKPGVAVSMMPDDFHSIEVLGEDPSLHLHLYGKSHAFLNKRVGYADASGGVPSRYPLSYSIGYVTAPELRAMLDDGDEIAVLDVREEGVFARDGHLLLACSAPLSTLEVSVPRLVPRRSTRLLVCDANDGMAQRAAIKLLKSGYSNVLLLEGGTVAWQAAGYRLYEGMDTYSKAFGEFIAHERATPEVAPAELDAWKRAGRPVLILDSRPATEYVEMSIPGGIDCPGAELAYRAYDLIESPETLVVVNCAGRTRSIMGAQSLIDAGLENPVFALQGGTMAWQLAGLQLTHGATSIAPLPSDAGIARATQAAAELAERFQVIEIDHDALAQLIAQDQFTIYRFDVRSRDEYASGHLPGFISAPGGHLIHKFDAHVGTRNAIVVLADNDGIRATMTAAWLRQMGLSKVYVLRDALRDRPDGVALEMDIPAVPMLGADRWKCNFVDAGELRALLDGGEATLIDIDRSLNYRLAHIPGAWHAVRSRLAEDLQKIPLTSCVALTSADGAVAAFASAEAALLSGRKVVVLAGGTAAWKRAGLPLSGGDERLTGPTDDVWYRAHQRSENVAAGMVAYLQWELDLMRDIAVDADFRFRDVVA